MVNSDRTCATCIWWERQGPKLANATRDPAAAPDVGTCQARSPAVASSRWFPVSIFPETHESRFCGEWQGFAAGGDGDDGERVVVTFPIARRAAA